MLLQSRNPIIYGGGGAIGGAVARAFAREGAKVFLAGRTLTKLDAVAEQIRAVGGYADTAQNPLPGYNLGGLQVAFGAIESLRRNLACELGP
jgi:NAD(P)-dependent dehydrogenase (short-subunit alcohol dehydrogenase family)